MSHDTVYVLMEKGRKVPDINRWPAEELVMFLRQGYFTYPSAEEAEEGRQAGDAYDEPGRTRVVGFRVRAFLPKIKKTRKGKRK